MGLLTLSKVDALWWLGRYTERVFTTLKTFFPFYDDCLDHEPERFRMFSDALDLGADMSNFDSFLYDFLYDRANPNSVCASMNAAFDNAIMLRPEIGTATLAYIELALSTLRDSKASMVGRLNRQRSVSDHLLTFWGALEDGTSESSVKAFVFAGKYVERMDLYARFSRPEADFDVPLLRLDFHLGLLPEAGRAIVADAVSSVADALVSRGYPAELADRLRSLAPAPLIDEEGNVVAAGVPAEEEAPAEDGSGAEMGTDASVDACASQAQAAQTPADPASEAPAAPKGSEAPATPAASAASAAPAASAAHP